MNSVYFTIKCPTIEKGRILELFFKGWLDDMCHNDVDYTVCNHGSSTGGVTKQIKVDFHHEEDTVLIKIHGIPSEFEKYVLWNELEK